GVDEFRELRASFFGSSGFREQRSQIRLRFDIVQPLTGSGARACHFFLEIQTQYREGKFPDVITELAFENLKVSERGVERVFSPSAVPNSQEIITELRLACLIAEREVV